MQGVRNREKAALCGRFEVPDLQLFFRLRGNVARACNACRKLSTGMTLTGPAYLRASFALSPAGTRKTSTPALAHSDRFCLTPPIGRDRAVEVELAGRRDLVARGRRRGRAPPARRARTRARPTGRRSAPCRSSPGTAEVDVGCGLDEDAEDRAPGVRPRRPVQCVVRATSCEPLPRRRADPHAVAGLYRSHQPAQVGSRPDGFPSIATMMSSGSSPAFAAGGSARPPGRRARRWRA